MITSEKLHSARRLTIAIQIGEKLHLDLNLNLATNTMHCIEYMKPLN